MNYAPANKLTRKLIGLCKLLQKQATGNQLIFRLNRGSNLNRQLRTRAIIILFIITIIASFYPAVVKADNENISIENANSSINQAFTNILAAEKAGGNVTQLLIKLNTAGELLAKAENTYNSGNLTNVTSNAESALQLADQVNSDALALRETSLLESQKNFWYTMIFSVVGAAVFGIALLLTWRRFKRSFTNKLLGMKPMAVENTAES
jgi:cytochrome bd-type quinol oxidase subunit 2